MLIILKDRVLQGSSSSITAEIIHRLRKSFELTPLNNENPHDLIKQCAATILDTIGKLDKKIVKTKIQKISNDYQITVEEKQLLDEFNQLPKHKRKMAISLFLAISSLVKS